MMRNLILRTTALVLGIFLAIALAAVPQASAQDDAVNAESTGCFNTVTTTTFESVLTLVPFEGYEGSGLIGEESLVPVIGEEQVPVACPTVPDEVLGLAITGSNVDGPVALGVSLIGAGGVLVLVARRRETRA